MKHQVKRKLRVIALVRDDLIPPDTLDGIEDKESQEWRAEYDVVSTLRKLGHEVWPVGVRNELSVIRDATEEHKPHVVFNLLEEFDEENLQFPIYETTQARAALEGTGVKCPPVAAPLVRRYLDWFVEVGFLQPPSGAYRGVA